MKRRFGISIFAFLLLAVVAWPQTQHSITIGWSYTQGADLATGFNVYRGTTTGGPYTKQNTTPIAVTTLTYVDTAGAGATKYFYVVTAIDSSGFESAFSSEVSATFLSNPLAPAGVTATPK